ncbi:putative rRNA-processing protein EBP2-like [Gracilariopsis chorda]|uniref:Putative rRNA-processing protein EBP2-like n=1 Tax=Gracilariopsis chorda TaxID=448386 RepID=A0A2V3IHX3_9FLOR|nr:putative rRNA-processing protein EBP2-like [Gracilariopsis chorda]|eukprot:PXF41659.1 putative rRNA-processing protein EBP2-like [Gracilariopsis chorda]
MLKTAWTVLLPNPNQTEVVPKVVTMAKVPQILTHLIFTKLVGIGDHSDESDEDAPLEAIAVSKLPSQTIELMANDEAAMEKKLSEIALFVDVPGKNALPFSESLVLTMPLKQKLSDKLALDDLEREKKFAELTTEAVHTGLDKLREQKIKFRRPDDYFAEMVKSDAQMAKIKTKILQQKEKIEAAETRRNNRDINKNRKKVRAEQKEREQEKKRKAKEEIATYSRLRKQRLKQREQGGAMEDDDEEFPIDLLDVEQLDSENRFQDHSDVASGKKKAWRPSDAPGEKQGRESIRNKFRTSKQSNGQHGQKMSRTKGGIQKRKGKKKRLGKSRRVASKKS